MPRPRRESAANFCFHVINRGNGRMTVFHKDGDYAAFLKLLRQANQRIPMRLLAYCLMPNHFHLVLWPRHDGDLSRWMQWLTTSHVRRYHRHHDSSGHVWQGRFKSFPVQSDEHLLIVMRYVERNPVRAKSIPVRKAQNWPWSSAGIPPQGTNCLTSMYQPWPTVWRIQLEELHCEAAGPGVVFPSPNRTNPKNCLEQRLLNDVCGHAADQIRYLRVSLNLIFSINGMIFRSSSIRAETASMARMVSP